jgi:hypothetical protein
LLPESSLFKWWHNKYIVLQWNCFNIWSRNSKKELIYIYICVCVCGQKTTIVSFHCSVCQPYIISVIMYASIFLGKETTKYHFFVQGNQASYLCSTQCICFYFQGHKILKINNEPNNSNDIFTWTWTKRKQ